MQRSILAISLVLAVVLAACGGGGPADQAAEPTAAGGTEEAMGTETAAPEPQEYAMGIAYPTSGDLAGLGVEMTRYHELGVAAANEVYAADGITLRAVVEDSQAQAEAGITALTRMASIEGAPLVATAISGVVQAMAPVADDQDVLLVNTGAESPDLKEAGELLLHLYPLSDFIIPALVDYSVEELGVTEVALLCLDTTFGSAGCDLYENEIAEAGGEVVARETVREGAGDVSSQIARLESSGADLVHMQAYLEGALAIQAMARQNWDVPVTVPSQAALPEYRETAGAELEGVIYTTFGPELGSPAMQEFAAAYEDEYGEEPSYLPWAPYQHGSAFVYAEAIKHLRSQGTEVNGTNLKDAILEIGTFELPLLDGEVTVRQDGTIAMPVTLKQVVDPAEPATGDEDLTTLSLE